VTKKSKMFWTDMSMCQFYCHKTGYDVCYFHWWFQSYDIYQAIWHRSRPHNCHVVWQFVGLDLHPVDFCTTFHCCAFRLTSHSYRNCTHDISV